MYTYICSSYVDSYRYVHSESGWGSLVAGISYGSWAAGHELGEYFVWVVWRVFDLGACVWACWLVSWLVCGLVWVDCGWRVCWLVSVAFVAAHEKLVLVWETCVRDRVVACGGACVWAWAWAWAVVCVVAWCVGLCGGFDGCLCCGLCWLVWLACVGA